MRVQLAEFYLLRNTCLHIHPIARMAMKIVSVGSTSGTSAAKSEEKIPSNPSPRRPPISGPSEGLVARAIKKRPPRVKAVRLTDPKKKSHTLRMTLSILLRTFCFILLESSVPIHIGRQGGSLMTCLKSTPSQCEFLKEYEVHGCS